MAARRGGSRPADKGRVPYLPASYRLRPVPGTLRAPTLPARASVDPCHGPQGTGPRCWALLPRTRPADTVHVAARAPSAPGLAPCVPLLQLHDDSYSQARVVRGRESQVRIEARPEARPSGGEAIGAIQGFFGRPSHSRQRRARAAWQLDASPRLAGKRNVLVPVSAEVAVAVLALTESGWGPGVGGPGWGGGGACSLYARGGWQPAGWGGWRGAVLPRLGWGGQAASGNVRVRALDLAAVGLHSCRGRALPTGSIS